MDVLQGSYEEEGQDGMKKEEKRRILMNGNKKRKSRI